MLTNTLYRAGVRGWMFQTASLGTIVACLLLWQRAKTIDQDDRGHAERRALYVGLWPPTFWLIGASVERQEHRRSRPWR
jgi:hypothetical protein